MAWWWLPALVAAGWPALNFAIRRGLAAQRVPETADPGALPWHAVRLPAANEKRLFGWFIPAAPGAPALVVMHGWGGNAEMMLPLAAPLHAAGYSLLLVWGFGVWWLVMASLLTLAARAAGQLPFALSWWGFIFPLGAFVAESLRLSNLLGWGTTFAVGIAAWLLLCFLWAITAVRTARGVVSGAVFQPHP